VRENQQVTQAYYGANWYLGEKYTVRKLSRRRKNGKGFAGHYHNDSPWYGDARVVLRKASSSWMAFSRSCREVMESLASAIRRAGLDRVRVDCGWTRDAAQLVGDHLQARLHAVASVRISSDF
jgi:hypothetical protein